MKNKTINADECSTIKMVAINEKNFGKVIDKGRVKEWVGIGWIDLRKATAVDRKTIPIVKR